MTELNVQRILLAWLHGNLPSLVSSDSLGGWMDRLSEPLEDILEFLGDFHIRSSPHHCQPESCGVYYPEAMREWGHHHWSAGRKQKLRTIVPLQPGMGWIAYTCDPQTRALWGEIELTDCHRDSLTPKQNNTNRQRPQMAEGLRTFQLKRHEP